MVGTVEIIPHTIPLLMKSERLRMNTYFVAMKGERAGTIRARLAALREKTLQELGAAREQDKANDIAYWNMPLADFSHEEEIEAFLQGTMWPVHDKIYQLERRLEAISFQLSLVTEPVCSFCGETWGLSQVVDMRFGVTREQAIRAGCFWCCGWCYAHVLNAPYANRPEMRVEPHATRKE